jgi:hypothetical protein
LKAHDHAFPVGWGNDDKRFGLSARDFLAALAMQGILAHEGRDSEGRHSVGNVAKAAYAFADALMAESEQESAPPKPKSREDYLRDTLEKDDEE